LFLRRAKLDWLLGAAGAGEMPDAVAVERGLLDDMRPAPFQNGEWLSIREAFAFSKSGMKSGNDPIFVAINETALPPKVAPVLAARADARFDPGLVRPLAYRPLDTRFFYNDRPLLIPPGLGARRG